MIHFENIQININKAAILHSVSGHIPEGAVTALIGPNGSGKSTLLSVLSGLREPNGGQCFIGSNDKKADYNSFSRSALAKQIALLPQRNPVPASLSVSDLVAFGRHPHRPWYRNLSSEDKDLIDWAMKETGIWEYQNRALTQLSGGELQRCWLAMVLAQNTPVLMLDEPTSWLDISHQISLLKIVRRLNKEHGKTVVWVLHDLNQASEFSDHAILLNHGKVVAQGSTDEVITPELVSDVYETKVQSHQLGDSRILWPEYSA
nr:iron ABC transporter [Alteromonas sp. K]